MKSNVYTVSLGTVLGHYLSQVSLSYILCIMALNINACFLEYQTLECANHRFCSNSTKDLVYGFYFY